jgi:hypothetical protein
VRDTFKEGRWGIGNSPDNRDRVTQIATNRRKLIARARGDVKLGDDDALPRL